MLMETSSTPVAEEGMRKTRDAERSQKGAGAQQRVCS